MIRMPWRTAHDAQFADLPTVRLKPLMSDVDVAAHSHHMYCRDLLGEIILAVIVSRAPAPEFPAELSSYLAWISALSLDLGDRIDTVDEMLAYQVAQVGAQ